jgi:hypothetical protein
MLFSFAFWCFIAENNSEIINVSTEKVGHLSQNAVTFLTDSFLFVYRLKYEAHVNIV